MKNFFLFFKVSVLAFFTLVVLSGCNDSNDESIAYSVIAKQVPNGKITVQSKTIKVSPGVEVVFTLEPNADYIINENSITPKAQKIEEGKYRFIMPDKPVTISVEFYPKPSPDNWFDTADDGKGGLIIKGLNSNRNPTQTTITIPISIGGKNVTGIGEVVFAFNGDVTKVNIPYGVTSIGYMAFVFCTNLEEINLPETVTSIDEYAFSDCTALTQINLPEGLKSIGPGAFGSSGLKKVTIPSTLTYISSRAFIQCVDLEEVVISSGVKVIDDVAFEKCVKLKKITIPEGVVTIGGGSFMGCVQLKEVAIPKSVIAIGNDAFRDCSILEIVKFYNENVPAGMRARIFKDSNKSNIKFQVKGSLEKYKEALGGYVANKDAQIVLF